MGAISALSTTGRTLKRNGVLFAAAFVVTLANVVPTGVTFFIPPSVAGLLSLPLSLVTFALTPFFIGGLLSMAHEGIDGVARFDTFVEGGKANYFELLGAMVLFAVLLSVLAVVVVIGFAVVAVFVVGMNSTGAGGPIATAGPSLAILLVLGLVAAAVVLLPAFFLQFYAPAVVVSDLGIVESLKRSAHLVRRNVVSALGYSAIAAAVGLVAGVASLGVTVVSGISFETAGASSPEFGVGVLVAVVLVSVVVSTVVSAFGTTYQVAFYDDRLASLD